MATIKHLSDDYFAVIYIDLNHEERVELFSKSNPKLVWRRKINIGGDQLKNYEVQIFPDDDQIVLFSQHDKCIYIDSYDYSIDIHCSTAVIKMDEKFYTIHIRGDIY